MSKIIAIDASTEACSVALLNDNEVTERYQLAPRQHAKLLLPLVSELLTEANLQLSELDAIACNVGPGAFTGIRIAVSVAQGLAFGSNIPAISMSTLENLAFVGAAEYAEQSINKGAASNRYWLTAIDARMNEVYFGVYKVDSNDQITNLSEPIVIAPNVIDWRTIVASIAKHEDINTDDAANLLKNANLIGSGWKAYETELFTSESPINAEKLIKDKFPSVMYSLKHAESKLRAGKTLAAEQLQPIYLRNNVAQKKKQ